MTAPTEHHCTVLRSQRGQACDPDGTTSDPGLARAAIDKWGHWEQVRQAQEECTELALALRHWERGKVGTDAVATEIADVEIMLEQLRLMVPRDLLDLAREKQRAKARRAISGEAEQ